MATVQTTDARMNRREFLNLAWLASIGILIVDIGGVAYVFAMPRFRGGQFGGLFDLGLAGERLPLPGGDPLNFPKGKFWLVRTANGLILALYKVCTHLGCIYNWRTEEDRFICPCHGSQFQLDGTYIRGPAPRSLDRFVVRLLDEQGNEVLQTDPEGNAIPLTDENLRLLVDSGRRILGKPRGQRYPTSE